MILISFTPVFYMGKTLPFHFIISKYFQLFCSPTGSHPVSMWKSTHGRKKGIARKDDMNIDKTRTRNTRKSDYSAMDILSQIIDGNDSELDELSSSDNEDEDETLMMMGMFSWNQIISKKIKIKIAL